jgi:predicted transcriptional regulator
MNLQEFIVSDVEPIEVHEPVARIQDIFSQFTFSHLPVMRDEVYLGCLSENDARCFNRNTSLDEVIYAFDGFFVRAHDHWLDVLESFTRHDTNLMPVLNKKNKYMGYYELKDVMCFFNESPFLAESGAVIVVEKGTEDYSFSEISQIVETNDAKLFGCFISDYREHLAQITLKVTSSSINEILQTFRRYGYTVITTANDDTYLDSLKERSDYLSKYLEL